MATRVARTKNSPIGSIGIVCSMVLLAAACGSNGREHTGDHASAGARADDPADGGRGLAGDAGVSVAGASGNAGASDGGNAGKSAGSGQGGVDGGLPAGGSSGSSGSAAGEGSSAGAAGTRPDANNDCLDGIDDYTAAGPFAFEQVRSGSVQMWIPNVPRGCKVPIAHFSNGTGASCSSYRAVLEHLASHGFLTACYETTTTGTGMPCVTAIETVLEEYPDIADRKVGSGGHATGGGGALLCVAQVETKWAGALQIVGHGSAPDLAGITAGWPAVYAQIGSPIFIFNGSEDFFVSENTARMQFDALAPGLEAYWYEGLGATHIPVPARWIQESMVAWFRWKLLGDRKACEHVKAMPNSDDWDAQAVRNASDC